jgi:release factor glutamine methyltransferase
VKPQLYRELFDRLQDNLVVLQDKPEETTETTLAALWCAAAGTPVSVEKAALQPIAKLDTEQRELLCSLVEQRLSGVPLAHITGRQQFMGIELLAGPEALIPRKETEILGGAAITLLREMMTSNEAVKIIDVCTGAGNLAVVMALSCPFSTVYASDLSANAVSLARENAVFHSISDRLSVSVGDLFASFDVAEFHNAIDLITCNPPYISTAKVAAMEEEISDHEPALAFDGGPFGIKILHRFIKEAPRYLKPGGWLAFEVGSGQGPTMVKRMQKNDSYSKVQPLLDENGQIRAILACNGTSV